jgi:FkbM family methyltransferase
LNWSAIDNHSLAGRALRAPLRLLPPSAVMKIRRGPAKGLKWIAGSSEHGCWLGTYELPKQNLLERLVRPGMTVYDIGAQAGFYTLCLSRMVGETGRVFAFEPFADNVRNLLEHVRMNGLRNVRIVQAAVAGCSGVRGFTTDQNACGNALAGGDAGLLVPTVGLDLLSLPPPHLIKMDIEGGELEADAGKRANAGSPLRAVPGIPKTFAVRQAVGGSNSMGRGSPFKTPPVLCVQVRIRGAAGGCDRVGRVRALVQEEDRFFSSQIRHRGRRKTEPETDARK